MSLPIPQTTGTGMSDIFIIALHFSVTALPSVIVSCITDFQEVAYVVSTLLNQPKLLCYMSSVMSTTVRASSWVLAAVVNMGYCFRTCLNIL